MRFVITAALIAAALVLGSLLVHRTNADPQAEGGKKERLEAVQKRVPEALNKWWLSIAEELVDNPKPLKTELKLKRWVGPSEVKLTYRCEFEIEGDFILKIQAPIVLTFVLRHFDGKWTTTSFYSNNPVVQGADLMLRVDQALAD